MKILSQTFIALLLITTLVLSSCRNESNQERAPGSTGVSLHTELGGNAEGYDRACGPREFKFPQDHGPHPTFRNEWWYITGNLTSDHSTRLGFHATFFRIANKPAQESRDQSASSNWATDEFYMAHFAISQEGAEQTRAHERFSRSAAGLAGASVKNEKSMVRVWLDDWQLLAREVNGALEWQLMIKEGEDTLDLTLAADKPIVLQGHNGYSQKSADPCNSSYYYSMPRLQASGSVMANGQPFNVKGSAWLDREWSSSALADDQIGWDWFALQLDDGRDIMFYQLRKADGTADPYSHAVQVNQQGIKTEIPLAQIKLDVDQWWQSDSGARYPVGGRIVRSDTNEVLVFKPLIENQELNLTVRYWEGAIKLSDENGKSIGKGYLELTGY